MITNKATTFGRIFERAREYLLSFEGIDEYILDRHLDHWKEDNPESVQDLLRAMLHSVCNRQGMSNAIGSIRNLRPYLLDFNPPEITEEYNGDWKNLFRAIEDNYSPPGRMVIDNPWNYWVIFCKSIISASHFLSHFSTLQEFEDFVSQFYLNEYTRLALPLLLAKEIFGLGFALACNFLKENGYPQFVKPDVHIKAIFYRIGISESDSSYDVFKAVIRFSEAINELPYRVDKLFWLVGSGNFYLEKPKKTIKTNRDEFIERIISEA